MMGEIRCSTHTIDQLVHEVRHLLTERSERPRNLLCLNAHIFNVIVDEFFRAVANGHKTFFVAFARYFYVIVF